MVCRRRRERQADRTPAAEIRNRGALGIFADAAAVLFRRTGVRPDDLLPAVWDIGDDRCGGRVRGAAVRYGWRESTYGNGCLGYAGALGGGRTRQGGIGTGER